MFTVYLGLYQALTVEDNMTCNSQTGLQESYFEQTYRNRGIQGALLTEFVLFRSIFPEQRGISMIYNSSVSDCALNKYYANMMSFN